MELDWRFLAPTLTGFGMSAICQVPKNEGKMIRQRPPSYVFGIVWPILYLLLGYSWMNSKSRLDLDVMHGVCTSLLTLWIIFYSCLKMKLMGVYIIACTIAVVVCCMSLHNHRLSVIALTPLLAWLTIAFQLNWNIV